MYFLCVLTGRQHSLASPKWEQTPIGISARFKCICKAIARVPCAESYCEIATDSCFSFLMNSKPTHSHFNINKTFKLVHFRQPSIVCDFITSAHHWNWIQWKLSVYYKVFTFEWKSLLFRSEIAHTFVEVHLVNNVDESPRAEPNFFSGHRNLFIAMLLLINR